MKYCKKCGIKNKDSAQYCSKCGSLLVSKNKNPWIFIFIIIIFILLIVILVLRNNIKKQNNTSINSNQKSLISKKISKDSTTASEKITHSSSQDIQLVANNLNDKQIAAVATYWADKNLNGEFSVWNQVFAQPSNSNIIIEKIPNGIDLIDPGEGNEYVYSSDNLYPSHEAIDSYFYTISNDCNIKTINFYHVKENMQTQSIAPVGTVQLDKAVDFINQNHLGNKIMQNIDNVQLLDNR